MQPGTHLDQTGKLIKYSDFVNKELILFSMADLQRSIPSMVDGLKPGQRKILFCSFKRNFVKEAKVAQFSGYVSEHSAYHHGESFVASTIIEFTCYVMQCELDCTEFLMKINAACRILI